MLTLLSNLCCAACVKQITLFKVILITYYCVLLRNVGCNIVFIKLIYEKLQEKEVVYVLPITQNYRQPPKDNFWLYILNHPVQLSQWLSHWNGALPALIQAEGLETAA